MIDKKWGNLITLMIILFFIFLGVFISNMSYIHYIQAEEPVSTYDIIQRDQSKGIQTVVGPTQEEEPLGDIRISVKARDAENKTPILQYRVVYGKASGLGYEYNMHSESGKEICELWGLHKTSYRITVLADGYEPAERIIYADTTSEPITFELIRAKGKVVGRAIDTITSEPIEGVLIEVSDGRNKINQTSTNKQGLFKIDNLRQSLGYLSSTPLYFKKKGYAIETLWLDPWQWKENLGDIVLVPTSNITGKLLNPSGNPVKKVEVILLHNDVFERVKKDKELGKYLPITVLTDEDGNFKFEDIKPGAYALLYGSDERDLYQITLDPRKIIDITLTRH